MTNEYKELLKEFEQWLDFCHTLNKLDDRLLNSSLEEGKWSIKANVSHIMLWDKYFYEEAIERIAKGEEVTLKHLDFDEFNSKAADYATGITKEELIEKAIVYRKKIIHDLQTLSQLAVEQNYIDGDGNVFNVTQYLKDFIWHDQHHMVPLIAYLNNK